MSTSIRRELLQNQIWHGLNFLSKALFLGVLTPFLLSKWGADRYGMYALASSLVVVLAAMDGGIRDATRMALCEADRRQDRADFRLALQRGVLSFLLVVVVVSLVALGLAHAHLFSRWLKLPDEGDLLIAVTIFLTGLSMAAVLMLEPLAARNQLSLLKKVNTFGSAAALPAVALCVAWGGGPLAAVEVYFVCQLLPYLYIWHRSGLSGEMVWWGLKYEDYLITYRAGGWLYLNNVVWLIRNHALPFLVSALDGPSQAGTFYILLRLSEVISTMGAASSETLLASLRSAQSSKERLTNFHHTYDYCLVFCGYFTLTLGCLGMPMITLFFKHQLPINQWDLTMAAVFGLAGAVSYLLFYTGYGVNVVWPMALCNLAVGLLTCLGCVLFQSRYGHAATLAFGTVANLAMIPCARIISRQLDPSARVVWWLPAVRAWPTQGVALVILLAAYFSHRLWMQFAALALVGGLAIRDWKRLHSSS